VDTVATGPIHRFSLLLAGRIPEKNLASTTIRAVTARDGTMVIDGVAVKP
jgi:hypothetical protein